MSCSTTDTQNLAFHQQHTHTHTQFSARSLHLHLTPSGDPFRNDRHTQNWLLWGFFNVFIKKKTKTKLKKKRKNENFENDFQLSMQIDAHDAAEMSTGCDSQVINDFPRKAQGTRRRSTLN